MGSAAEPKLSLSQQLRRSREADPAFARAHRTVQIIMGTWAAILLLDRVFGVIQGTYTDGQLPIMLLGGAALMGVAWLGTRGHLQGAMMVLQINLAVFLLQFASICFFYRESTSLWTVLFYGAAVGGMIACSLVFFFNREVDAYRRTIWQWKRARHRSSPRRMLPTGRSGWVEKQ